MDYIVSAGTARLDINCSNVRVPLEVLHGILESTNVLQVTHRQRVITTVWMQHLALLYTQ